ncbi:class I SAM-dependent methyltransferase [Streptacidiphilus anmyonensis]|uniref:class I SAM-dependent methyltransferase n=1 Tax=Streptacidiphilus anmyonensis TaxID=405782 RepID=UPI0005A9BB9D|nr:class I SAM-dependent methyltransferase [Streptacidiphilus anmyonensis]
MPTAAPGRYAFDNDSPYVEEQHRCLAAALDPITTARLATTGVGPGWRCLEVGAGRGSVALWLAERAAPGGRVLATDLRPEHIPSRPGLETLRHDIVHDPLPEAAFDLIHSRLVLTHLPQRRAVLVRLLRALRPGGWLQLEEFDIDYAPVLLAPDERTRAGYQAFQAAKGRALRAAGADPSWGRSCAADLRAAGFTGVEPVPHLVPWHADSPGLQAQLNHLHHLRDALVAQGLTEDQCAAASEAMRHPAFRAASSVLYCVQARRPS